MSALKGGLLMDNFKKSLLKTIPQNFLEMLAWVEKYARLKDSLTEPSEQPQQWGVKSRAWLTCISEMMEITTIQDPYQGEKIFHRGGIIHLRDDLATSLL